MDNKEVRVRFAPSPTGHLHIGSLRTAIFNWLYARHMGGKYLLRIEDTDRARSTKEFETSQLKSLKWFDLMPDEPIIHQFDRIEEHKKIAHELMNQGLAYPCFCEPKDAEQIRKNLSAHPDAEQSRSIEGAGGFGHKYPGTCRDKKWTEQDLQKPHAIRIKIPEDLKWIVFKDLIRGKISVSIDQLDDFVIVRRDGTPTYNFSVVLDDVFSNITHVIRGEDHISNTPKQIIVYNALKKEKPFFAHLPLILGSAGNKLSKRDGSVSVEEYRAQGFLVPALFNYLVRLGWSHGDQEVFSRDELVKLFLLEDVGKKGAIFDIKKLQWLNGIYLRELSFDQMLKAIGDLGVDPSMNSSLRRGFDGHAGQALLSKWSEEQLKKLFELYAQRAETVLQLTQNIISLSKQPENLDLNLIAKWHSDKTAGLLKDFIKALGASSTEFILRELEGLRMSGRDVQHEELVKVAKDVCANFDLKLVALAQPIRLALTGTICSPGVFELIEVLGKDETIKRIESLIKSLSKN